MILCPRSAGGWIELSVKDDLGKKVLSHQETLPYFILEVCRDWFEHLAQPFPQESSFAGADGRRTADI